MKKKVFIFILILIILPLACNRSKSKKQDIFTIDIKLDTPEKKTNYTMGYNMGKNFLEIYQNIDQKSLIKGIIDAINKNESLLPSEELSGILIELQQKMANRKRKELEFLNEKNKLQGKDFLEKNAKKKGIEVTASGLQYQIIKKGNGAKPVATDRVKVHYKGTLINGTEFDSSYKRGSPAVFGLNEVIPGWTEALPLMNVGSKYIFYIPSELAYKERGAGNVIEPNSTLIFEIELLEILKSKH